MAGLRLDFLHLLILFGLSIFFSLLRFLDFLNRFWTFWKKWTKTGPIQKKQLPRLRPQRFNRWFLPLKYILNVKNIPYFKYYIAYLYYFRFIFVSLQQKLNK